MPIDQKSVHYEYVPDEFYTFVLMLDLEMFEVGAQVSTLTSLEKVIDEMSEKTRVELGAFLSYLLSKKYSDAFMEEIWQGAGSRWRLSPGYHRIIYEHALQHIRKSTGNGG